MMLPIRRLVFCLREYHAFLYPAFGYQFRKMFKRPVVGSFGVFRKTAGRQRPAVQMIGDTVAANSFSTARFIRAVAFIQIFFFFAFQSHIFLPLNYV